MKFVKFTIWKVQVPAKRELIAATESTGGYASATDWPMMPIHLVEGTTDTGIVAIGESTRGESPEIVDATLQFLLEREINTFHPANVWSSNHQPNGLPARYLQPSWNVPTKCSYMLLESLWLDAVAQAANVPVSVLFGGAVRDRVAVDYWANRPNEDGLQQIIETAIEKGLHGIKLKCDASGDTVHALAALSKKIPVGFHVTIDPMCAWRTYHNSYDLLKKIAELNYHVSIEDPYDHQAIHEWRRAKEAFPQLTFVYHARNIEVLRCALDEDCIDALNLGGGACFDFLRCATVAQFHQYDCWAGSGLELGVLQHLRLHAAASAPNCVLPSDLQSEWVRQHTLVSPRMQYRDGSAIVPNGSGLGVSLDHEAINRHVVSSYDKLI